MGVESLEEARDGSEAIEVLKSFEVNLAIIDWKMDGINGVECVQRIRADTASKFLPIIMVTGYTEASLVRDARNAGVDDFLAKPISAKSLLSRIVAVLEEPRKFIHCDDYFGPDRRRGKETFQGPDQREKQTDFVDFEQETGKRRG